MCIKYGLYHIQAYVAIMYVGSVLCVYRVNCGIFMYSCYTDTMYSTVTGCSERPTCTCVTYLSFVGTVQFCIDVS